MRKETINLYNIFISFLVHFDLLFSLMNYRKEQLSDCQLIR